MSIVQTSVLNRLFFCAIVVGGSTPAVAASAFEHGLYLGFETLPTEFELSSGPLSTDEEFDSAYRFAFGYRGRSPQDTAFVINTGLAFSQEEYENLELHGFGFFAEPGISFRVADGFTVDVLASFGIGIATVEETTSGLDENGSYADIGIVAQPGYRWPGGFRLAARLGLLARTQTWDPSTGAFDDVSVDSGGATIGLQIGYAF